MFSSVAKSCTAAAAACSPPATSGACSLNICLNAGLFIPSAKYAFHASTESGSFDISGSVIFSSLSNTSKLSCISSILSLLSNQFSNNSSTLLSGTLHSSLFSICFKTKSILDLTSSIVLAPLIASVASSYRISLLANSLASSETAFGSDI